jgi:hypothetical protein
MNNYYDYDIVIFQNKSVYLFRAALYELIFVLNKNALFHILDDCPGVNLIKLFCPQFMDFHTH